MRSRTCRLQIKVRRSLQVQSIAKNKRNEPTKHVKVAANSNQGRDSVEDKGGNNTDREGQSRHREGREGSEGVGVAMGCRRGSARAGEVSARAGEVSMRIERG